MGKCPTMAEKPRIQNRDGGNVISVQEQSFLTRNQQKYALIRNTKIVVREKKQLILLSLDPQPWLRRNILINMAE